MIRLRKIWRSMPLRLALMLVLLFATVSLLSLAASYAVTQRSFHQAIRADLAQDMAGFRAAPSARAVALLVEAESRDTDPRRLILSYVSSSGAIFGNGAIARDHEGFHIMSLREDQAQFDGEYLLHTASLYGGQLTIARSRAEIVALRAVFVNILWISLAPTVLIALGGGLVLARRSKRHVEVISGTLDDLTTGELDARVLIGPRWSDDLVQIGDKVNQMAQAQGMSVAALRQVSSDIAHDLKTPVQRVSLQLDELAGVIPDGEAAELVGKAQHEVAGIAQVFEALLQLAQLDSGALRDRFELVDLSKLCRTMVEIYEPTATEQGQVLQCQVVDAITVMGDRALLGQMLANLIENALRHAPMSSAVKVSLTAADTGSKLSVTDAGPGIPEQERTAVLRRLYRLDRSRHTLGNGLGLSLVDAVARLHGATLVLADAAPGLRVEVQFPDHSLV
ncbi:two-component sensor histidine kinase [Sulfitobacter sp. SK012]|uniref:sensor histidine kinase n=1 Tax=Sulfitobacter sp. SK012 TaxID=1389005 RepID=UPI000E0C2C9E|nr:HAMP domain-containing sensor histidine kinase [Sulfitobacter sp. SK012]AXI45269.1 two-component sensor histidine kinase [Sulfitobacter sp. SK012]